jgi:hypothetical protein
MRNSLWPLVMVVCVVALTIFSLRGQAQPGMHGPDIFPGIFRLPKKDKFPIISADAQFDNQVSAHGPTLSQNPETWRVILISAVDRKPMTRAVVLSLAEQLTKNGSVVIVDPAETPAFPMGCDRVLSVATLSEENPTVLGEPTRAQVEVHVQLARFSATHPAAVLFRDEGTQETQKITLNVFAKPQGVVAGWPQWWAACGRQVSSELLRACAPQGVPAVSDEQTKRWLATMVPPSDWGTPLSQPLTTDNLHWDFGFQEDLIRGWSGHITGMSVTKKNGAQEPSVNQLMERVKAGQWELAGAPDTHIYRREQHGHREWFAFSALPNDAGWSVSWWQEREGILALFEQWFAAAQNKDDLSAAQLAQRRLAFYRKSPLLPPDIKNALSNTTQPTAHP